MKKFLSTFTTTAALIAFASTAHAQVSFGIRIGAPPAERAYRVPPQPGPDYVWVEGYQYPVGSTYKWHDGYWTRPPYEGAYWVAPYYAGGRYYAGQWQGSRGNLAHNHAWDRSAQRDEHHAPAASGRNGGPNRNNDGNRNGGNDRNGRNDGNRGGR